MIPSSFKPSFRDSIDYTVQSHDHEHYNRVIAKLPTPITQYSSFIVSSLTANCDIVVLDKDDYIQINGVQYSLNRDFTSLNGESLAALMTTLFNEQNTNINMTIDSAGRCVFTSAQKFVIERMTYNFTLLTGFYNTTFPIYSDYNDNEYNIISNSVGFNLSTPILYLLSNVGNQSYHNINETDMSGQRIVMRLNNSFSSSFPIVVNNGDFETMLPSNDLSMLEFSLVDAFLHEIKLLSPMYLCIHVRAIEDQPITTPIFNDEPIEQQPTNEMTKQK